MLNILNNKIQFLAASIRNERQLIAAAINGADVITVPPKTWEKVYNNKYTLDGEKSFMDSWNELPIEKRKKYEIKK